VQRLLSYRPVFHPDTGLPNEPITVSTQQVQARAEEPKTLRRKKRGVKKSGNTKRLRQFCMALILLLGFSLVQCQTTGTVSWPTALIENISASLKEYSSRPEAGWRQAADTLNDIGAAREGNPIPDFDLTGRVVRVADGDTVSILDRNNEQHKVRLYGIDTPERDQPHGQSAKRALSNLVDDQQVGVVVVETDSYGRQVGTLYRAGTNINLAMVSAGHAWWYQYYAPHERHLALAEQKARQQGLGLWSNPRPVPPWDWRRRQR
jgi:endonuclease YncB( thermonuclease family)